MKLSRLIVIATLTAGLATLTGCAAMRASGARHEHIEKETESYTYDKPLSVVWPQARQLLFTEGFEVKDTDASNAETSWKSADGYRSRYLLSGIAIDDTHCQVQFTKAEEQKNEKGGWYEADIERDLGMEWKLIQKAAPDNAKKIKADADSAGEKAGAAK
jgi:hypothetical protein